MKPIFTRNEKTATAIMIDIDILRRFDNCEVSLTVITLNEVRHC